MIAFIDEFREEFGGEPMERQWSERQWRTPICSVLPIAPSTCHERKAIASEPARASRRAQRDAVLREQISKLWSGNRGVYGARKIWHALRRDGVTAARCTVERLRREMGLKGVVRGKKVVTTNPDAARPCPDDKVNRAFHAARPNQLWVSDFTCVPTWSGTVYVAFVIDVFAREPSGPCIARNSPPGCFVRASPDHSASIGWRVSTSMTTQFVLDALEQALWQRKPHGNNSLIHHSDRGSQYLSITYTERLADADIDPSVGTVGDSYDNALAECVIGLFKTEVIKQLGPWKSMQDVEWETMHRVDWYNENRLLSSIGYVPPAEAERRHLERTDPVDKVA